MRSPLAVGTTRALLCVLALGGGAGLAHATSTKTTHASAPGRARSVARAERVEASPSAVVASAPAVVLAPAREAPSRPFGEAFRDGLMIAGGTPHRIFLFTFDDGPNKQTTPILLDKLDRAGVKAVFFLSTHRIRGINRTERDQAAIARDAMARGHIVANHTMFHVALPTLDTAALLDEIENSERVFVDVLGARPWLFRPPYGTYTERTNRLLSERGYTIMLWNIGTGDPQVRTAAEVFDTWKNVLARREQDHGERGGVILMHDTHAWTVEAFDLIFAEIERRNCALLETDEELYDIVDDPGLFFAPRTNESTWSVTAPLARMSPEVLAERQRNLREKTTARCETLANARSSRL